MGTDKRADLNYWDVVVQYVEPETGHQVQEVWSIQAAIVRHARISARAQLAKMAKSGRVSNTKILGSGPDGSLQGGYLNRKIGY